MQVGSAKRGRGERKRKECGERNKRGLSRADRWQESRYESARAPLRGRRGSRNKVNADVLINGRNWRILGRARCLVGQSANVDKKFILRGGFLPPSNREREL